MLKLRKSEARGYVAMDWLKSWHTFSFGQYHDPAHMHHRSLRVINQDIVAPAGGFAPHPHQDMEIVTYIIRGRLAHEDSTGNKVEIGPGEIQRMTAGSGIVHSEFNPSQTEETELLQIWLLPASRGLTPGYEQKHYDTLPVHAGLRKLVSPTGKDGSVRINQDVVLYKGELSDGEATAVNLAEGRHAWIQLISGELTVNELKLAPGDGLAISKETTLKILALKTSEYLLFDLS
jgi:redox-sensitive bicupin YhaK (pirin superfamily)